MIIARGGEETEDILSSSFGVLEVRYGCEVREGNLLEKTLFGGGFVEGEEVGSEDKVEGFPLLRTVMVNLRNGAWFVVG